MSTSPSPSASSSPSPAPSRPAPESRDAYRHFQPITTRWSDNDAYGHVNNVVYYGWFDTVVNAWLIRQGLLDVTRGEIVGLVVETRCNYFSPLAFPEPVEAALRVAHIGTSSVRYEIGIFAQGAAQSSAGGHFIHCYVDRPNKRPVALTGPLKAALQSLRR